MDTVFNYGYERGKNDGKAYFSSDEQKWITKIRKLKEKNPDEVHIIEEPENNDGCIYCIVPQTWLRIIPTQKRSAEDIQKAIENFKPHWKK